MAEFPTPDDLRAAYEDAIGHRPRPTPLAKPLMHARTKAAKEPGATTRTPRSAPSSRSSPAARSGRCSTLATGRARPSSRSICSGASPTPGSSSAPCSCATATNSATRAWPPSSAPSAPTPPRSTRVGGRTRRRTPASCRHLPDARRRHATTATPTSSTSQLPARLLQPHRHRRVPPLGLGQVVRGAHPQPERRPDRPDRHAAPARLNERDRGGAGGRADHAPTTSATSASRSTSTTSARASRTATSPPARSSGATSSSSGSAVRRARDRARAATTSRSTTVADADHRRGPHRRPRRASATTQARFEAKLLLPDRVDAMAGDLFDHLSRPAGPSRRPSSSAPATGTPMPSRSR